MQGIAGKSQNYAATNAVEQTESQLIIQRLHTIRGNLGDARGSIVAAADKIVGHEPQKIANNDPSRGDAPAPSAFLPQVASIISEIDRMAMDINEQLNRLHRSF